MRGWAAFLTVATAAVVDASGAAFREAVDFAAVGPAFLEEVDFAAAAAAGTGLTWLGLISAAPFAFGFVSGLLLPLAAFFEGAAAFAFDAAAGAAAFGMLPLDAGFEGRDFSVLTFDAAAGAALGLLLLDAVDEAPAGFDFEAEDTVFSLPLGAVVEATGFDFDADAEETTAFGLAVVLLDGATLLGFFAAVVVPGFDSFAEALLVLLVVAFDFLILEVKAAFACDALAFVAVFSLTGFFAGGGFFSLEALFWSAITLSDPSPRTPSKNALSCLTFPRSSPRAAASCFS